MEPLFFKAENSSEPGVRYRSSQLQWSRFFSKRKMEGTDAGTVAPFVLQWSRFFSKRKITQEKRTMALKKIGFNGAAFFQSGK